MSRLAAPVLLPASAVVLGGCYRQIVYPGTGAYDKRVASFAVSPARAAELAAAAAHATREARDAASAASTSRFAGPSPSRARRRFSIALSSSTPRGREKFKCLPLTGFHVNGDDGTVAFRKGHCLSPGDWTGRMPTEAPHWAWINPE